MTKFHRPARWGRRIESDMPGESEFIALCSRPPIGCNADWLRESYSYPILTRQQELHLFIRLNYRKWKLSRLPNLARLNRVSRQLITQIEDDMDRIARCNMRLVDKLARKYSDHLENMISTGQVTLVETIHQFNPFRMNENGRPNKFCTYAVRCILRSLDKENQRIYLSPQLINEEFIQQKPDGLTSPDLSAAAKTVKQLVTCLTDRERLVISERFGLDRDRKTHAQIADILKVSRGRIRQIEIEALNKIRAMAGSECN